MQRIAMFERGDDYIEVVEFDSGYSEVREYVGGRFGMLEHIQRHEHTAAALDAFAARLQEVVDSDLI
jgi:hypothetical protein